MNTKRRALGPQKGCLAPMPEFIPGLKLSELFYHEAVRPLLDAQFPGLAHAAALIGSGSEVLGFDTEMSSDHHWGPRVMLFLPEDDSHHAGDISEMLRHRLPRSFRGYSTNFTAPDPEDNGTQLLQAVEQGPVNHRVEIHTLKAYCQAYLGIDPDETLTPVHWLTMPGQKLRSMTAGMVCHDGPGELTGLRERLAYYPQDLWFYLLAAGWARVAQEEHFLGRTGYVGDELGSRLIAGRLVHDLMNLCFLMEKQYAPYSKWFGTAFSRLACGPRLTPIFHEVLAAPGWQEREEHLCRACEIVAAMHNALGITDPLPAQVSPFFDRPFRVIHAGAFAAAIKQLIHDEDVRRIAAHTDIGAVEQFSTSTDLLSSASLCTRLRSLY